MTLRTPTDIQAEIDALGCIKRGIESKYDGAIPLEEQARWDAALTRQGEINCAAPTGAHCIEHGAGGNL